MKKLLCVILLFALSKYRAQTNVSGGIYSNTTWSLANSPYIVVDTVVVFPGVILTIQPGVVVKFNNNKRIEVRQSTLNATGTSAQPITFTSNSSTPTIGIWAGLMLNGSNNCLFNHCNFFYANNGIYLNYLNNNIVQIKNSTFIYNNIGIGSIYYAVTLVDSSFFYQNNYAIKGATGSLLIDHSQVKHNQNGIIEVERAFIQNCIIDSNTNVGIRSAQEDTIQFNEIKANGIGFQSNLGGAGGQCYIHNNSFENNTIGIDLYASSSISFLCNTICNNTTYDLKYEASANTNCITNNYWCTLDSTSTEAAIYDGYDNTNVGLVYFMPIDSTCPICIVSVTDSIYNVSPLTWDIVPNYSSQVTSATWYWGDGTSTNGLYPSHIYASPGLYNICVTAYASCGDSFSFCQNDSIYRISSSNSMVYVNVVSNTTGITQNKTIENQLLIYPNPGNGIINISSSANIDEVTVSNMLGQTVYEAKPNASNTNFELNAAGIYYITTICNKQSRVQKVIVQH